MLPLSVCAQHVSKLDSIDSKTLLKMAKRYKYGINTDVNLKRAAAIYKHLARKGHIDGMRELGELYINGQGVERDYRCAARLLKRAAQCEDTKAMCLLAEMYQHGRGLKQNYGKAFELYNYAAYKGYGRGCYGAGYLIYKGFGVKQDYALAEKILKKGSDLGDEACSFLLGSYYMHGYGGTPDYDKAEAYYNRAMKRGYGWTVDITKHGVMDSLKRAHAMRVKNVKTAGRGMTYAAADSMKRYVSPDSLVGTWTGTLYTCDWSGRTVLKEQSLQMSVEPADTLINVVLTLDGEDCSFYPVTRKGAWWRKLALDEEDKKHNKIVVGIAFGMDDINTLAACLWIANTKDKERRKPMFALLMRDNPVTTLKQTPFKITSVSPMPITDNAFTVKLQAETECTVNIDIFNLNGVKVANCGTRDVIKGDNALQVNAALSKGQYILRVTSKNGNEATNIVYK